MNKQKTILAIHPNQAGFGYAVFDSPSQLEDFGMVYIQPISNTKSLVRIKQYIDYFNPIEIAVKEPSDRCSPRIQKLIDSISQLARTADLPVNTYSRADIQNVFEQFEAFSKHQISKRLIEWFPILKPYGFPKRSAQMAEHHYTGLFDALSLGITHYYLLS
ncbi:MAG: hypothetical protein GC181_10685 [Bacteroidetes bacterium]|nr:hypothetical protein [Bacteroidota bacterium]